MTTRVRVYIECVQQKQYAVYVQLYLRWVDFAGRNNTMCTYINKYMYYYNDVSVN